MSVQPVAIGVEPGTMAAVFERLFSRFDSLYDVQPQSCRMLSAGLAIDCRGGDSPYLQTVAQGHLRDDAAGPPDLRILHLCREDAAGFDWPVWSAPFFEERQVEAALQGTRFRLHYFDDLGFWQIFDAASRRGIQLVQTENAVPQWDAGSPLRNFIHWGLLTWDRALVHAGTLAVGGQGVLIAGKGGSGKSGTVLAGLMNGLQSVGDDYVALSGQDGFAAHPAFRTLKIDAGGAERARLPSRACADKIPNWQGKYLLRLEEVAQGDVPPQIAVRAILLPRITHTSGTTFHPVSAKAGFLALAPSGVTQIPSARPEMVRVCGTLSRGVPCFEMRLGTRPEEIAGAIGDFITRGDL